MNEPTFFQVAMVTAGIAALCATLTWIIRSRIMSVSSRPPRTIPDRLFTAFLTGMAAFMVGATLLSSAAGPLTSFKGIVGRLLVGFMLAAVAFVVGLFLRKRLATILLALSALVSIPSFIGSLLAHFPHSQTKEGADTRGAPFKRLLLPHGISLDVPTTWIGFSPAVKGQLDASVQAAADLSGLDYDVRQLHQLLDIRQPLTTSYARLILSVDLGKRLTQAQVKTLTMPELLELESEYKKSVEMGAKQMTLRIIEWYPIERRDINGKSYFLVRYVRSSPTAGQSTYVEMYQLHDTDKSVNFSIEYRLSDKVLWDPVCRRSLISLHVD